MTNFEKIKSMTEDELAAWLLKNGVIDNAPWDEWFIDTYCNTCDPVDMSEITGHFTEEAYCEHYNKCRFFGKEQLPIDIINLWLEANYES